MNCHSGWGRGAATYRRHWAEGYPIRHTFGEEEAGFQLLLLTPPSCHLWPLSSPRSGFWIAPGICRRCDSLVPGHPARVGRSPEFRNGAFTRSSVPSPEPRIRVPCAPAPCTVARLSGLLQLRGLAASAHRLPVVMPVTRAAADAS